MPYSLVLQTRTALWTIARVQNDSKGVLVMPPHNAVADRTAVLQKTQHGEYHPRNELSGSGGRPAATAYSQEPRKSIGKLHQQQGKSKEDQGKSEIEKHTPSAALKLGDHAMVKAGHLILQATPAASTLHQGSSKKPEPMALMPFAESFLIKPKKAYHINAAKTPSTDTHVFGIPAYLKTCASSR
jgi:hypothetical protein